MGPRADHSTVVFDDKMWVIAGGTRGNVYKDVWYSSDGINWHELEGEIPWEGRFDHATVVFDNKIWIIAGSHYTFGGLHIGGHDDVWVFEKN